MSDVKGRLITCARCGKSIFTTKMEGEWGACYLPKGWTNNYVSIPGDTLCPECTEALKLTYEKFMSYPKEHQGEFTMEEE